jgi:Na+-transporting NADH:ubiquinone oxidoreductase subunit A
MSGKESYFQTGINAAAINDWKTFKRSSWPPAPFSQAQNVQINTISGPHPAGNVGVQIHH